MMPWAEIKALGGFILLAMAVDLVGFAVLVVRAL